MRIIALNKASHSKHLRGASAATKFSVSSIFIESAFLTHRASYFRSSTVDQNLPHNILFRQVLYSVLFLAAKSWRKLKLSMSRNIGVPGGKPEGLVKSASKR